MSLGLPSQRRVGFYPCCANDVREPVEILAGQVDHIIFCDRSAQDGWNGFRHSENFVHSKFPSFEFRVGPWRKVVSKIDPFDLLFYRRDSEGEGGSGDSAISTDALQLLFGHMSDPCWIITDGKYDPDCLVESVVQRSRAVSAGRMLKLESDKSLTKLGLVRMRAGKLA